MRATMDPIVRWEKRGDSLQHVLYVSSKRYRDMSGTNDMTVALPIAQKAFAEALAKSSVPVNIQMGFVPEVATAQQVYDWVYSKKKAIGARRKTTPNYRLFAQPFIKFLGGVPLVGLNGFDIEKWRRRLLKECVSIKGRTGTLSKETVSDHLNWLSGVYQECKSNKPCTLAERPILKDSERRGHGVDCVEGGKGRPLGR